ncbi:MAG: type I 3-dehydroquinate dehydratase [Bacteroidales bacterium]|nr:type I 3-dehydroquinate dehydratase [Bacteroidales bacterium]
MICTSFQNLGFEALRAAVRKVEMGEIRLDRCALSDEEIDALFSEDTPLIATCRVEELLATGHYRSYSESLREAERRLSRAVNAGARYVDVELGVPKQMSSRLKSLCHESGTMMIRSYHNFEKTPSEQELDDAVRKCLWYGADIVKIATMAFLESDCQAVLSLYDKCKISNANAAISGDSGPLKAGSLVAFCMGEAGSRSRLECLRRGAPFTYAAPDSSVLPEGSLAAASPVAPGQMGTSSMMMEVYESSSLKTLSPESPFALPCSKSFAQRSIICAALASGRTVLAGYTPCGDNESALALARAIGATVTVEGPVVMIDGIGAAPASVDITSVNVGESGLLTRLMIPLLSVISESGSVTVDGEKTLRGRVLSGLADMMDNFSVGVSGETLPLKVSGSVDEFLGASEGGKTIHVTISGKYGSQLVSGLLMALPLCGRNITLTVEQPRSIPYMFITLDVLKKFGIKISSEMLGPREFLESGGDWTLCDEMVFKIKGGQRYSAAGSLELESDWSAAANFAVAGSVFGRVEMTGLDTASVQADLCIMDILIDAGASLSQLAGDPVTDKEGTRGHIVCQKAPLSAVDVDATHCPDLFPIVSVLAAFCEGESRIKGLSRLAHKESDRAEAILEMLEKMGVPARREDDTLVIQGHSLASRCLAGTLLRGGNYSSRGDHRMAMALRVASLGASSPIVIDDTRCVAKSFPGFNNLFDSLVKE